MGQELSHIVPGFAEGKALPLPCPSRITPSTHASVMGRFGQVYDASTNVARSFIKFLYRDERCNDSGWADRVRRFNQEFQRMDRFHHSHLARADEFITLNADGWPSHAIVMPRYGATLQSAIDLAGRRPLPPTLVMRWCREMIYAIEELHGFQYVHRDLKPNNIFLHFNAQLLGDMNLVRDAKWEDLPKSKIVVGDFGCLDAAGNRGIRFGRDHFKPPHLFDERGVQLDSHRVEPFEDIHALGKIFELLAEVTEGNTSWLKAAAKLCFDRTNPISLHDLRRRVSRDFTEYEAILRDRCGHRPADHPHFQRRDFVRGAFDTFASHRMADHTGGVFLVVAEAGVGKTALMTNWAEEERTKRHTSPAAYYFRFRDGRTPASDMPRALFDMLKSAHDLKLEWGRGNASDQLRELFRELAVTADTANHRQLIFVDGLDECSNPAEAVESLPRTGLPDGIFLILSSRPPTGANYLEALELDRTEKLTIEAMGQQNLANLADFFLDRRPELSPATARQLAEGCGGMFQLAVLFLEDLQAGRVSVEQFLTKAKDWVGVNSGNRMYAYYAESWKRMKLRLKDYFGNERQADLCMNEFAALLTASMDWLSFPQLTEMLPWMETEIFKHATSIWDETAISTVQTEFRWLTAEIPSRWHKADNAGYVQFRHQSIRDFFVSSLAVRAVNAMQKKLHAGIGKFYLHQVTQEGYWSRIDAYGRQYTPRHLILGGENALTLEAVRLMCDLEYLAAAIDEEPTDLTEDW